MVREWIVYWWRERPRRNLYGCRSSCCCGCGRNRNPPALDPDIVAQVLEPSITSIEATPRFGETLPDLFELSPSGVDSIVCRPQSLEGCADRHIQSLCAVVQGATRSGSTRCQQRADEEDGCQEPHESDPHGRHTLGSGGERL
jgi:hypothetical protein